MIGKKNSGLNTKTVTENVMFLLKGKCYSVKNRTINIFSIQSVG